MSDIMLKLYNETSDRLCLMNTIFGRIKGLVTYPFLRTETQIIDELKKILSDAEAEYKKLWDYQLKRAEQGCDDCSGKPICGKYPDFDCKSDISDCCGKPITLDKDSCTPVCTKCDQECNAVGGIEFRQGEV